MKEKAHEREIDITLKTPFNLLIVNNAIHLYV